MNESESSLAKALYKALVQIADLERRTVANSNSGGLESHGHLQCVGSHGHASKCVRISDLIASNFILSSVSLAKL